MKNTFPLLILVCAMLLGTSSLYAQDCATSSGSFIPTDICGSFDVSIGNCTVVDGQDGYLLYYDFDVSTTPTTTEIYDDLIGAVPIDDAAWLGELSDCSGFFNLAPIPIGCTLQDVAFYIIPANITALAIDTNCPIEGPIISTVYPTFTLVGNPGSCDVAAEAGLVASDGTVCDFITGITPVLPPCTTSFGNAVNDESLTVTYTAAQQAAITGGTPPTGCYTDLTETYAAQCFSFACTGTGCQLANLEIIGASCNNNGTAADPTDDFWLWDFEFNFVDGTTYSITDNGGGAGLAGQAYTSPASQVQTIIGYAIPANGQGPVIVTITDDGDPACSVTINVTDLLTAGVLVTCSACTVFSGSSVTTPVCAADENDIGGTFTVDIGTCDISPDAGDAVDPILIYDLDVTNTPPTDLNLYEDIIGAVPVDELVWFGEVGSCTDPTLLANLEGFQNPSCSVFEIDLYVMPADLTNGLISFACPIEGPIRLTIEPGQPTLIITSCDAATGTAEATLGFDVDGDGTFGGAEDEICDSGTYALGADGTVTYSATDISNLFSSDGACYTDAIATCPCEVATPGFTFGELCADGTYATPPYTIADDGTGENGIGGITEYLLLDNNFGIVSIDNDLSAVQAAIDAAAEGETICLAAITHTASQLDQILTDLDDCTGGLASSLLGLTPPLTSLEQLYDGLINANGGVNPLLTPADIETYVSDNPGGPSAGGGMLDVGVLAGLPAGLIVCTLPPFCYSLSDNICFVKEDNGVSCDVLGCTNPCATNYDQTATTDDGTCMLPEQPTLACYETATFNDATCVWDVTGTQPVEPTLACYETATFNDATCIWDVTGTQPVEPTLACYETATFNDATCVWDVTGTQPEEPTTACYETAAFNDATCVWDVTGEQPEIDDNCEFTDDSFDAATCAVVNTPNCAAGEIYDAANCACIGAPMAMITDPCNCLNGIDLDGDGISDIALETITITDPTGAAQGWTLTANDGGLVNPDGATPTTAAVMDNGNGTYTLTAYVVADGATTFTVSFTATDGEMLFISGGPCNMCSPTSGEVPTVGEWGLIILGLLMSITAIVGIRQREREGAIS